MYKLSGQFLPIIVKIRLPLWNLELGHFLGPWFFQPQIYFQGNFWVLRPRIWPSGNSNGNYGGFPSPPGGISLLSSQCLHSSWFSRFSLFNNLLFSSIYVKSYWRPCYRKKCLLNGKEKISDQLEKSHVGLIQGKNLVLPSGWLLCLRPAKIKLKQDF